MSRLQPLAQEFGGNNISQSWNDLYIWEQVLNQNPPTQILELGTFTGGMAVYLNIQALLRGASFMSFDVMHYDEVRRERFDSRYTSTWKFPFMVLDIRSEPGITIITEMIQQPGTTILFCDNGNKVEESHIYAGRLKQGDIIAVHDWNTEYPPNAVPPGIRPYEPAPNIYEELESWTRFFIKEW